MPKKSLLIGVDPKETVQVIRHMEEKTDADLQEVAKQMLGAREVSTVYVVRLRLVVRGQT